jgi:hypothetical protein
MLDVFAQSITAWGAGELETAGDTASFATDPGRYVHADLDRTDTMCHASISTLIPRHQKRNMYFTIYNIVGHKASSSSSNSKFEIFV